MNLLFEQLVNDQNSWLHALKQRLSPNRWFLPLRWCSSDYIIRIVFTLSWLCNPETSFFIPNVDSLRDAWRISDYIIQKVENLFGLWNPSIAHWHQHPSGWFKFQNPRIWPDFIIWM